MVTSIKTVNTGIVITSENLFVIKYRAEENTSTLV